MIVAYCADHDGMVFMLKPVIKEMGQEAFRDRPLYNRFYDVLNGSCDFDSDQIIENLFFAIMAMKKYEAAFEEACDLIRKNESLKFCFDKHMASGVGEAFFESVGQTKQ